MSKDIDISDLPPPDEDLDISDLPPPDDNVSDLPAPEPSTWDAISAGLGHFARGATFGYGDKIAAGIEAAIDPNKDYNQALKEQYAKQEAREKAFPWLSKGGEVAGLLTSPVNKVAGAVAAPFNALSKMTQLEKVKKLIDYMKVAATGTTLGAIAGEGYDNPLEKKDPDSWSGAEKGALAGAILGPLAKFAPWVTGGAAVGATMADKENMGKGAAWGAGLGTLVEVVARTPKGQQFMAAIPGMIKTAGNAPREWLDKFYQWTGKNIVPEEFVDKAKIGSTGSQHVDKLLETFQQAKQVTDLAGLRPMEPLKDVWFDEAKKKSLLEAIQASFRNRQRNAADIPLQNIEEALAAGIKNDENALLKPIDEYIYTSIMMPMAQRVAYSVPPATHPGLSKIQDPGVKQFLEMGENLKQRLAKGELNENLLAPETGSALKYGDVGGMSLEITPEMMKSPVLQMPQLKSPVPTLLPTESMQRMDAQNQLMDVFKGRDFLTKRMPWGVADFFKGLDSGTTMLNATGKFIGRVGSEKMNAQKISESFVANPNVLEQLSKRDSTLGRLAGSALKSLELGEQDGLKTKMYLFSMNPEFRRLFLGDTTNQDPENPKPTSSTDNVLLHEAN